MRQEFARFAGEIAESFSFNRSLGQIYGFLYAGDAPASLDDIAEELGMSKGNASINLRVLEGWGAVRRVWVAGSRRDHYEADKDVKKLLLDRVQKGLGRRLDQAEEGLERLSQNVNGGSGDNLRKRLSELKGLVRAARRLSKVAPRALAWVAR